MAKTETNNLSVNIKVAVRIRPGKANDQEVEYDETKNTISGGHGMHAPRPFTFDRILGVRRDQQHVYDCLECEKMILDCCQGYNSCIVAYGQTGSGKTYTIEGIIDRDVHDTRNGAGLAPRSMTALFRYLNEMHQSNPEYTWLVRVSFLEIYNDNCYDLLNKNVDEIRQRATSCGGGHHGQDVLNMTHPPDLRLDIRENIPEDDSEDLFKVWVAQLNHRPSCGVARLPKFIHPRPLQRCGCGSNCLSWVEDADGVRLSARPAAAAWFDNHSSI